LRLIYSGDAPTAGAFQDFAYSTSSSGTTPPPTLATPTISQSGGPSGTVFSGTSFTMTATVSSAGPQPTGTVTFTLFASNGGNNGNLCNATALSAGSASCAFAAPASGSWVIHLTYSGDANTASASQDYAFSSQQAAPTITQSGLPAATIVPGTNVTMVATVSSGGPTPTGNATFKLYQANGGLNGTLCLTVALSGGNAGCTFTAPASGSWFVRVIYSGDTPTASATQDFALSTQQAAPAIGLAGRPSGTVLPGTSFAMTVSVVSTGPTPTGGVLVDLYETNGGFNGNLCSLTLSGGSANCNMNAPANGSYLIRVTYSGDTSTAAARQEFAFTSQQATPTINQAGGPTGTISPGQSFTMTATVSSPGPVPTGTVSFRLFNSGGGDNGSLGNGVVLSGGSGNSATFSVPQGSWFIRVTYSGDTPTASALRDFPFTSQLATPTITQTGGPSGAVFPGSSFTMQAHFLSGGPTPTGTATFTIYSGAGGNNGTPCALVPIGAGTATCAFNVPATNGPWFVRVNYSGDANTASAFQDFAFVTNDAALNISPTSLTFGTTAVGSSSAPQTVTLTNASTGFVTFSSITVPAGYSRTTTCGATLPPSASCTVDVTFTPQTAGTLNGNLVIASDISGSPQSVSLTGTGALPPSASKAFSPATVAPGGTTTLTITIDNFNPFPIDFSLLDVYPAGVLNAGRAERGHDLLERHAERSRGRWQRVLHEHGPRRRGKRPVHRVGRGHRAARRHVHEYDPGRGNRAFGWAFEQLRPEHFAGVGDPHGEHRSRSRGEPLARGDQLRLGHRRHDERAVQRHAHEYRNRDAQRLVAHASHAGDCRKHLRHPVLARPGEQLQLRLLLHAVCTGRIRWIRELRVQRRDEPRFHRAHRQRDGSARAGRIARAGDARLRAADGRGHERRAAGHAHQHRHRSPQHRVDDDLG
jgi:uncharacterized protein YfaP (DUF2135 family)